MVVILIHEHKVQPPKKRKKYEYEIKSLKFIHEIFAMVEVHLKSLQNLVQSLDLVVFH
jgi:hypothetical protein